MNRAFPREHAAPAVDERATQCPHIEAHCDLIGKSGEDATLDRVRFCFAGLNIEAFVAGDGEELFPELSSLSGRAGIDAESPASSRIEATLFRITKGPHQNEEIGFGLAAQDVITIFAGLFAFEAAKKIAALGERCDERNGGDTAVLLRGEQHLRVTRVYRERQHPAPDRGNFTRGERAEIGEQLLRTGERLRIGRLEPAKCRDIVDAARFEGKHDFGEIESFHFR